MKRTVVTLIAASVAISACGGSESDSGASTNSALGDTTNAIAADDVDDSSPPLEIVISSRQRAELETSFSSVARSGPDVFTARAYDYVGEATSFGTFSTDGALRLGSAAVSEFAAASEDSLVGDLSGDSWIIVSESVTYLDGQSLGPGSGTGAGLSPNVGDSPPAETNNFVFVRVANLNTENFGGDAGVILRAERDAGGISAFEPVRNAVRFGWVVADDESVFARWFDFDGGGGLFTSHDEGETWADLPLPSELAECSRSGVPVRVDGTWATTCDGEVVVGNEDMSTWTVLELDLGLTSLTGDGSPMGTNSSVKRIASDGKRLLAVVESDFEGNVPWELQLMQIDVDTATRIGSAESLLAGDETFDFFPNIFRVYTDGVVLVGYEAGGNGDDVAEQRWVVGRIGNEE